MALSRGVAPSPLPFKLKLRLPILVVLLLLKLLHTWRRLVHEIDFQSLLGLLGQEGLVVVQLLLLVVLSPQV